LVADNLIGHEDVADSCRRHDFRLAELLTRDPDRARGEELVSDRGDLLTLGVGPPRDATLAARGRDPRDVAFHDIEIDAERRSVEAVLWQSDDTVSSEHRCFLLHPYSK
jgi:hypothetical protein